MALTGRKLCWRLLPPSTMFKSAATKITHNSSKRIAPLRCDAEAAVYAGTVQELDFIRSSSHSESGIYGAGEIRPSRPAVEADDEEVARDKARSAAAADRTSASVKPRAENQDRRLSPLTNNHHTTNSSKASLKPIRPSSGSESLCSLSTPTMGLLALYLPESNYSPMLQCYIPLRFRTFNSSTAGSPLLSRSCCGASSLLRSGDFVA
ncbi:hypothetical protein DFH06DRAFT_1292919 [Mycena polygramma]|nr:hypothetical protein DFH06DRAFT_1292919 [Mycena polygramma]